MGNTATVRYIGPHAEGVDLDWHTGAMHVDRDVWVELPDDVVHGAPHVFEKGYTPKDDEPIDMTRVVSLGRSGLLEATELVCDPDTGDSLDKRVPMWELQGSSPPASTSSQTAKRKQGAAK